MEIRELRLVLDASHRARRDPFADRTPLGQNVAAPGEHVGLQRGRALLGDHGLRTGLHDVELAVETVLGPLHVHRPSVVILDGAGVAGEFQDVGIGQAEPRPVGLGGGDVAGGVLGLALDEDHLHRLVAEVAAQYRAVTGRIGRLVDIELVGVDGALNHVLAQSVGAGDEHGVAEARFGVDGKHHPR